VKSDVAATESNDALEYLLISIVLATRRARTIQTKEGVRDPGPSSRQLLGESGRRSGASAIWALEVIWTPADPQRDALSKDDLVQHLIPELRRL
jgi:uncharacterized membrane protein